MQILGECSKCNGNIIKNSLGDATCFQCGKIFEYSKTDLKENRRLDVAIPGRQRVTPKRGTRS